MATTDTNSKAKSLAFDAWPPHHREAWDRATAKTSLFQEDHVTVSWRPQTAKAYRQNYGHWLHWIRSTGVEIIDTKPEDLINRTAIEAYIAEIKKTCSDLTCYTRLSNLFSTMRVMCPHHDWTWLNNAAKNYRKKANASKEEKKRPPEAVALVQLGLSLMERAETEPPKNKKTGLGLTQKQRARSYRDGLMIALLASRVFRAQNFADLELGESIQIYDTTASLLLDGQETKEGNIIECEFPPRLFPHLQTYLTKHRLVLLENAKQDNVLGALWISENGTPLNERSITGAIKKHTYEAFGYRISMHKFRHAAATSLIEHDPKAAQMASKILGHKNGNVTEKHYNQANPELGVALYTAQLAKLRE